MSRRRTFLAVGISSGIALGILWQRPWSAEPDPAESGTRSRHRPRAAVERTWSGEAEEAAAGDEADVEEISVRGRVYDAIDGTPIADAIVTLSTIGSETLDEVASGERGEFALRGSAAASELSASAPGYALHSVQLRGRDPGEEIEFALDPAVHVRGRVVDERGEPIAGAEVWITDEEPGRWDVTSGVSTTDARGDFEVPDAPMGRLVAHARHASHAPGEAEVGNVGPGGRRDGVEIVLAMGGIVAGRVREASGAPAAGAQVVLLWTSEDARSTESIAQTSVDGTFRFDAIAPGAKVVFASGRDGVARANLDVRAGEEARVDLALADAGSISGTVVFDDGTPAARASVYLSWIDDPSDDGFSGVRAARSLAPARTDEDGAFRLPLPVRAGPRGVALSARIGNASGRGVARGGMDARIVVEREGTLSVRVEDTAGRPVPRARLEVVSIDESPTWRYRGMSDRDGTWTDDLRPGRYRIEHAGATAARVEIRPSARTDATIVAASGNGKVEGRLVGPDGKPVPGARISLALADRDRGTHASGARLDWALSVRSNAVGRFSLEGTAGAGRLFVYHPEMQPKIFDVAVPEGGTEDLGDVDLRAGDGRSEVFELSGIGAVIVRDDEDNRYRVRSTVPDSPAARAGLREGDVVLEVDGVRSIDLEMGDLISRIRGPTGTTVSLLLERPGNAQPFLVDIVREQIRT